MKKILLLSLLSFVLPLGLSTALSANNVCANCGSGSSNGCQQCRMGKDSSDARKRCEKMGCKITGTSSCSTAANVKVCG